jgi:cell division protein FtsL
MQAEQLKTNLLKILSYGFLSFLILLIIAFTFLPKYTKIKELQKENQLLSLEIEGLQKRNRDLQQETEMLKDSAFYLEKIAREELGAVKENEVAIHIEE